MKHAVQEFRLTQQAMLAPRLQQSATLDCPYRDEGKSTYSGDYSAASSGNEARQDISDWVSAPSSLRQHLSQELGNYVLSDRDRLLTNYVINALDDDGYLHTALEDLAKLSDFSPIPDIAEWRAALQGVQQLNAPGLGARSLQLT